jgi:SAM-dependent methyltransferase
MRAEPSRLTSPQGVTVDDEKGSRAPGAQRFIERGCSTATPLNVTYRVGRIEPYVEGRWLDFGCADGGYSAALLEAGASAVDGVDVEAPRIAEALSRNLANASFTHLSGSGLPFSDNAFDGAFVNEVMEHVADEQESLAEIRRVLKPSGCVVVISPNRWFPIEGHVVHVAGRTVCPAPFVPWLPERLTRGRTVARNYWPHQLVGEVRKAGFKVIEIGYVWPVLQQYPWLPAPMIRFYQRHFEQFDDVAVLRKFGVSTLVVGRKP